MVLPTTLSATEREDLKRSATTKIRHSGAFPAVVYGKGKENTNVSLDAIAFTKAMREAGRNGILQLQIGTGNMEQVMLQDVQTDPLKGEVVHADFYIVDMKSEVDVEVTVHLIGESQGVKDGGILQQPLHQVSVRSLPGNIPEVIEYDISNMEVGDSLQIKDLKEGRQYEVTDDEDTVIASILPPQVEEVVESGEVQDGEDVEAVKQTEDESEEKAEG